ncbi:MULTISPECIES: T6SS immunity protein Tli4 family protein [unclassified Enterobacter]|uniref:T6SS immunity protein Tli4 family protein n=1 Tax=unclassified Enterobacter TaxID=2608935 RepID=UPI0011CDFC98|nr:MULTISPECIES: T6SS immunity protein Tli4 family protein [unclassified Enterobacter]
MEIEVSADNGLAERYSERRNLHPELYGNNVPQRLAELISLLTRISGKKETDIPVTPGFCLPEIFIADDQEEQEESIDVIYKPSGYPMLKISFYTDNVSRPGSSQLERSALMKQKISEAEGRTLESGKRNINGLYAEQWLAEGNTGDGIGEKAFRFAVNIHEKTAGPTTPQLSVNFVQRGLEGNGLLSENEAISVWQTITDTLRMRPGAY